MGAAAPDIAPGYADDFSKPGPRTDGMHVAAEMSLLTVGPLAVYADEGLARIDGQALSVSGHTFGILVALARRPGEVVSREDLYREAWGAPLRPGDRSVDVFMCKLRAVLAAARPRWTFIQTHHRDGYRLAPQLKPGRARRR